MLARGEVTRASDVARSFEAIAPIASGVPGDELGFVWGDPSSEVKGVACVWSVQTSSIEECAGRGMNMIICHEGLWLPEQNSPWYDVSESHEIYSNRLRRDLLQEHEMVVYRSHSNWDALRVDGVPDQAVAALGLKCVNEVARQKFFSVHELEEPLSAEEFKSIVASGLGFDGCRLFGDRKKRIRRFAFLIGGFGENQWHMPQAARDLGAEAIILGEMSEFIVIACLEMGLPVIETLHSVSEIPAIKRQAEILNAWFPDLPVQYIPSGARAF